MGLFSMKGRTNRAKYILTAIVVYIVIVVIAMAATFAATLDDGSGIIALIGLVVSIVVYILSVLILCFVVVKRLHDLDRPGSHFWFLLVPFYNIYIAIILLFMKGTAGKNQFGADPLAKK